MSIVRSQPQSPLKILQRLVILAQTSFHKASLPISLCIVWISRNGLVVLENLGFEILELFTAAVRRHGVRDEKGLKGNVVLWLRSNRD
ncbi:hypothetical protein ABIA43_002752 [Bradyrhizobium sp. USDA 328]